MILKWKIFCNFTKNIDNMRSLVQFLFSVILTLISFSASAQLIEKHGFENPIRKNVYVIANDEEFGEFLDLVGEKFFSENDTILIGSNLSVKSAENFTLDFVGVLDGQNHKIDNVSKTLFNTNYGVIKNISLASGNISGRADVGSFCMTNRGTIQNCESRVNITATVYDEYMHVGGICAYNYGDIVNCVNYGSITCTLTDWSKQVTRCGGITSYSQGKGIFHCINYGSVTTNGVYSSLTGGIVADLQGGKVIGCSNYGTIFSKLRSATINDHVYATYQLQYTGGILGQAQEKSLINRCRNYGKVSSNFQYVGGIAGQVSKTSIFNVINFGEITSDDGWGYSCAAGITGFSHGVSEYYYFYNCINHGKITSTAHYDIATSAGISSDLKNCFIANCSSFGSVGATVLGGTATSAFRISGYEYEQCVINNEATTIEDANDFILRDDNKEEKLLSWYLNDEEKIDLYESFISYPVATHGECSVFVFPESDEEFQIEISGEELSHPVTVTGKSPVKISGIFPSANYIYTIKNNHDSYEEEGQFITLTPAIGVDIDNIGYDMLSFSHSCNAHGISSYSCNLWLNSSDSEAVSYSVENSNYMLENLEEDKKYTLYLLYSLNGKQFKSEIKEFSTNAITPRFSLLKSSPYSLTLQCENFEELKKYSPSIHIISPKYYDFGQPILEDDITYRLDDEGKVEIKNLQYGYSPDFRGEYVFNGETRRRPIDKIFTTENWGGEGVMQVSAKAAMIHGLFGGLNEKIPESWNFGSSLHYYRDHFFQYIDALNPNPNESIFKTETGATIDGNVDIAITIPLDSPVYQYRMRIQDDKRYNGKYAAKDGEWQIIDATKPTVDVVTPRFYAPNFNNNTISISFIDGEETTENVSLQYKLEIAENYNDIQVKKGSGTSVLSQSFSTLIPSMSYLFRFYSTTDSGKKYFSKIYRLSDGILAEATDIEDDVILGIENPSVSTENIRLVTQRQKIMILNKGTADKVDIYDLYGRIIYSGSDSEIEIGYSGVFILKIGKEAIKFVL